MTVEQAHEVVKLMLYEGYEAEVYENYSGRGMYGETVPAIVTSNPYLVSHFMNEIGMSLNEVPKRQDNMGLSWVIY